MDFTTLQFHAFTSDPQSKQAFGALSVVNAIVEISARFGLPSCAVGAVVLRESGGDEQAVEQLPPGVFRDPGVGLMQITFEGHDRKWFDPTTNVREGCRILKESLLHCSAARGHLDAQQRAALDAISPEILYFAFGGYNAGYDDVVRSILVQHDPDRYTTDNYCAGTLAIYHRLVAASQ